MKTSKELRAALTAADPYSGCDNDAVANEAIEALAQSEAKVAELEVEIRGVKGELGECFDGIEDAPVAEMIHSAGRFSAWVMQGKSDAEAQVQDWINNTGCESVDLYRKERDEARRALEKEGARVKELVTETAAWLERDTRILAAEARVAELESGETRCPYCNAVQPRPLRVMRSRKPRARCRECKRVFRYRPLGHETCADDSDAARVLELNSKGDGA